MLRPLPSVSAPFAETSSAAIAVSGSPPRALVCAIALGASSGAPTRVVLARSRSYISGMPDSNGSEAFSLIDPLVTDSYEVIPGRRDAGLLLLCDHARNAIPDAYGTLGLPADQLERHIAYDIGAEAVTRILAQKLGAPAICYALLAAADRSQSRARRSDAHHAHLRRRGRSRQPPRRRSGARPARAAFLRALPLAHRQPDRAMRRRRRAAGAPVGAQLHRKLERHAATLACGDPVGSRLSFLRAVARSAARRGRHRRRRERALRRQARRRLHVAARHAARPRAYHRRGAPGSHSLGGRAARLGRAPGRRRADRVCAQRHSRSDASRAVFRLAHRHRQPRRRSRAPRKGTLHDRHRPGDRNASSRRPPFAGSLRICASAPTCRTST